MNVIVMGTLLAFAGGGERVSGPVVPASFSVTPREAAEKGVVRPAVQKTFGTAVNTAFVESAEPGEGIKTLAAGDTWVTWQVFDPLAPGSNSGFDHSPHMDRDSYGYIYTVYSAANGQPANQNDTLWVLFSSDDGATWQWLFKAWVTSPAGNGAFQPTISVSRLDNTVYVAWIPGLASGGSFFADVVMVNTIQHQGAGVFGPLNMYQATTYAGYNSPAIASCASDSNYAYFIAVDWNSALYADVYRSSDKGATWTLVDWFTSAFGVTSSTDAFPRIGSTGALLSYVDNGLFGFTVYRYTITPTTAGPFAGFGMTSAGLRYHLSNGWNGLRGIIAFWQETSAANGDIGFNYTTDGGTSWSALQWYDNSATDYRAPAVYVRADGVVFMGHEYDPENDAYGYPAFRYSTGGAFQTFGPPTFGFSAPLEATATQDMRYAAFLTIWQSDITEQTLTGEPLVLWRHYLAQDIYVSNPELPVSIGVGEGAGRESGYISVQPNPSSSGNVTFRYFTPGGGAVSLRLYDGSGRLVKSFSGASGGSEGLFAWENAPAGVYIWRASGAGLSQSGRAVVTR